MGGGILTPFLQRSRLGRWGVSAAWTSDFGLEGPRGWDRGGGWNTGPDTSQPYDTVASDVGIAEVDQSAHPGGGLGGERETDSYAFALCGASAGASRVTRVPGQTGARVYGNSAAGVGGDLESPAWPGAVGSTAVHLSSVPLASMVW